MKIPFFTQSGEQPAPIWHPAVDDYVRFLAYEPAPVKPAHLSGPPEKDEPPEKPPDAALEIPQVPLVLSELLEPFRDAIGVITKVYRENYEQGYVMVAFIPEDVELEDVMRDSEDLRRYFHIPTRLLEKTTLVDQETKDMFEAIAERLEQEPPEHEAPEVPEPTPPSPDTPPLRPAPAQAVAVPTEPLKTDTYSKVATGQ